jgi:hypothetical protein
LLSVEFDFELMKNIGERYGIFVCLETNYRYTSKIC